MIADSMRRLLIDLILWENDPDKLRILYFFCTHLLDKRDAQRREERGYDE